MADFSNRQKKKIAIKLEVLLENSLIANHYVMKSSKLLYYHQRRLVVWQFNLVHSSLQEKRVDTLVTHKAANSNLLDLVFLSNLKNKNP